MIVSILQTLVILHANVSRIISCQISDNFILGPDQTQMILTGHLYHIFIHHANGAYLIFIAVGFEVR